MCVTRATQGEKVEDGIKAAQEKVFCPISYVFLPVASEINLPAKEINPSPMQSSSLRYDGSHSAGLYSSSICCLCCVCAAAAAAAFLSINLADFGTPILCKEVPEVDDAVRQHPMQFGMNMSVDGSVL